MKPAFVHTEYFRGIFSSDHFLRSAAGAALVAAPAVSIGASQGPGQSAGLRTSQVEPACREPAWSTGRESFELSALSSIGLPGERLHFNRVWIFPQRCFDMWLPRSTLFVMKTNSLTSNTKKPRTRRRKRLVPRTGTWQSASGGWTSEQLPHQHGQKPLLLANCTYRNSLHSSG